jgi:exonuclease III
VHTERWVSVEGGRQQIHSVYFPHEKASGRERFFNAISEWLERERQFEHVIMGDFNMSPRIEDGLYGDNPSNWTGASERRALQQLLAEHNLIDLYLLHPAAEPYTFEKQNGPQMTRFRCDLGLVSRALAERDGTTFTVDHRTRRGLSRFTDHSGLILEYRIT